MLNITCVGQKPVVRIRTDSSTPSSADGSLLMWFLNSSITVLDTDMSLNMPSNFEVN